MTFAIFRATLRLVFRSLWIWVVTLPMLALAWVASMLGRGPAAIGEFFHQPFAAPFFLGQMIATVTYAQIEKSQRVEETLEALPMRSLPALFGRAAAIFTAWLGAGTLIYLTIVMRAVVLSGSRFDWFLVWDWVLVLPLTLVFTTGMAYGIGSVMRRGFGAYLIVLVLFLAGSVPFNQMVSSIFREMLGGGPVTTIDFTLTSYFPLTPGPIFPDLWPLIFNRLHAVGVGVFWIAGVAWLQGRRRREGGTRRAGVLCVAGLAAVVLAFGGARAVWAERVTAMRNEVAAAATAGPEMAPGLAPPTVLDYRVHLTLLPGKASLRAAAEIELTATGLLAPFTLNRDLTVTAVTGPGGEAVPFTRSGDLLLLTDVAKSGTYRVNYEGAIWQWRTDPWNGLRAAAHIAPQSVVLPAAAGWYPLPGAQNLIRRGAFSGAVDAVIWHAPVPMRLEVSGGGLNIASNALAGRPVTSAWIIGTPYKPVDDGGVRFYASPGSEVGRKLFVQSYSPELSFLQDWVPLEQAPTLIEVSPALWATWSDIEMPRFQGALVVSPTFLMRRDNMRVNSAMLTLWWTDARSDEELQVHDVLKTFMAEIVEREVNGRRQTYLISSRTAPPFGTNTETGQHLMEALRAFAADRGLQKTGRLLESLRQSSTPLTFERVAAALKGE